MSYILYPYFWGRRGAWLNRLGIQESDVRHEQFLRAGAARVIVPVTPGQEARFLAYLESDPASDEVDRVRGNAPEELQSEEDAGYPLDTEFEDLWLELLLYNNQELARGSGTLTVRKDSDAVTVNLDSEYVWSLTINDIGREIYLPGGTYTIATVTGDHAFTLDRSFPGSDNDALSYGVGSVPFGEPWLIRLPTSHLILEQHRHVVTGIVAAG